MSTADSESDAATSEHNLAVDQFCAFTGSSREAATQALEACNWNLEMAVNMQMDYGEPVESVPPISSSSQPSTSGSQRSDEDNVRAPIPPKRQVLVDDFPDLDIPYGLRNRSQIPMFNNTMRDFQREARFREEMAAASAASASGQLDSMEPDPTKRQTLEDLFRPPLDLMFQGSFENAKDKGVRDNRWLMINVQDETEFPCQVLNRDVWSNAAVKSIIEEHFVFWQVYKNGREGLRYMQFYPVTQFPYVAILDPRTGENLKSWHVIQDSNMFCELVTDFLQDHPTPSGEPIPDSLPVPAVAKPVVILNHNEMSEEEQLKAAIAASLQEPIRVCDDDDDEDIESFSCDDDDESPVEVKQNNHDHVSENSQEGDQRTKDSKTTETTAVDEEYTAYLGTDTETTSLVLRFPDGDRQVLTVPCDTKLKAILLLVQSKGFSLSQYDIVAFHPKRLVHEMQPDATLSHLQLLKEQLFIQLKQ